MPRHPAPGIRDVAAAAGVSVTTVSDAINGTGRVSAATRQRVRRAADELGYAPSALARSLRAGQSHLLGLVVTKYGQANWSFAQRPYFAQVIGSSTDTALAAGYAMTVLPARRAADFLRSLPLDGLLVVDPLTDDPVVAAARAAHLPVVADRANTRDDRLPWVDFDHDAAVSSMCDSLAALHIEDRRAPVMLASDGHDSYTAACAAAYRRWCTKRRLEPTILRAAPESAQAAEAVGRALSSAQHPAAIFGLEDDHAPILVEEALHASLAVPEDVALGCFTETAAQPGDGPPIARLSTNPHALGAHGTQMLIGALEGHPVLRGLRLVDTSLAVPWPVAR